ncbi:Phosphoglycerate mutase [Pleurostoma richardsiae]|uniref:Phosphoglycerate mutase n=1 Tax=Pleurostoma richardsiae TaxID=41990 RepID=A0AA38RLW8_9PEZI|nr:Phosphoglycerate mutase [Pleurostoma richardsiae]
MGRAPAYVFVVRHGNRLDAANKQWHLHSPTPYDPPLTYSGWTQSKALGARIGEILREREIQDAAEHSQSQAKKRRRRRFKVVIHSSPFIRCVQTAIGISAGLATIPPLAASEGTPDASPALKPQHPPNGPSPSPHQRPTINTNITRGSPLALLPRTDGRSSSVQLPVEPLEIQKSVIRVDAFLGEWLTPTYFELITPPPSSSLMIASAKAELLRREDYSNLLQNHHHHVHSNSGSGQMWGMDYRTSSMSQTPNGSNGALRGLDNLASLAGSLPRSGSIASNASESSSQSRISSSQSGGYIPLRPAYAISHSSEIPKGYVYHARDYCLDVDYQWDSTREPLDWGSGGQFGEEWTEMHKRFRRGVQKLVDWYSTTENPTEMVTREKRRVTEKSSDDNECAVDDAEDDDVEAVVILVSHGAGCNALIGAITHQPVLMDVGLASLTMAVRKSGKGEDIDSAELPALDLEDGSSASHPRGLIPIHEYYDLRIFAATDHLHSHTPTSSRSPSVANINRGRHSNTFSSPLSGVFGDGSPNRSSSATANLSSARRDSGSASSFSRPGISSNGLYGITVGSGVTSFSRTSRLARSPSIGLWSPVRRDESPDEEDEEDDVFPNFDAYEPVSPSARSNGDSGDPSVARNNSIHGIGDLGSPVGDGQPEKVSTSRQLGSGAGGLWGMSSPRPPGEAERLRDMSSTKRRWTVNERAG